MLQEIIGEEASVNMLCEELPKFDDELILNHLELDFSLVQINDLDVD